MSSHLSTLVLLAEQVLKAVCMKGYMGVGIDYTILILGNLGAGKSTLTAVLYRILELEAGSISIDGIDIRSVDLFTLRSRLSIIPQVPLFALFASGL